MWETSFKLRSIPDIQYNALKVVIFSVLIESVWLFWVIRRSVREFPISTVYTKVSTEVRHSVTNLFVEKRHPLFVSNMYVFCSLEWMMKVKRK